MARKPKAQPAKVPAKMGRPTKYTPELVANICERIANGETLRAICDEDGMPARKNVIAWLSLYPEFRNQYARAREDQADSLAEEIIVKARNATSEDAQAVRVQVDALKWAAGKLKPKVYGEKVTQEHTGADGGPIRASVDLSNVPLAVLKSLLTDDDDAPEDT